MAIEISQLPQALEATFSDVYPGTDPLDLSEAPSGTSKKWNGAQLATAVMGAQGNQVLEPALVATTANLNGTYDNGVAGVGATLTNAGAQAVLVIDGVTMVVGARVLVWQQTLGEYNGIYTVTNIGSVSTNWVLTRATDWDTAVEIEQYQRIAIMQGTLYNSIFMEYITENTMIIMGASVFVWEPFVPVTKQSIQQSAFIFSTNSGTNNDYTANLTPDIDIASYGIQVIMSVTNANTGPSTLQIGLGPRLPITYNNGAALVGGELAASQLAWLVSTGTAYQLMNPTIATAIGRVVYAANISITAAALAAGASVNILTAASPTARYRLINMFSSASGSTNFSGGGGNRSLVFQSSSTIYGALSNTSLATTSTLVYPWGTADNLHIQMSAAYQLGTQTPAGGSFFAKYASGTTDYSTGTIIVSAIFVQTAL